MDFILSLTHFCEMHGPKSVLCTQVLPLECSRCQQPDPQPSSSSSSTSLATQIHPASHLRSSLHHRDTALSLSTNFSAASTTVESDSESPAIERHELFVRNERKIVEPGQRFNFSGARGDSCASCSLVVPEDLSRELPHGAPGSLRPDGKTKNGAPVLRSREMVCLGSGDHAAWHRQSHPSPSLRSDPESDHSSPRSYESLVANCHDHLLTYLTSRNPDDPANFSALRASVIRTLSRELLPAGMSDGRFCFGDTVNGYTIAYVFRLPDPKARGRRRLYAFVALAGKDACRAFRACPLVWEAFSKLAKAIEVSTVESQEDRRRRQEEDQERERGKAPNYTPVSSFLTHRTADPDGNPRKAGHIAARSLADMSGNDRIFSDIHARFVSLLHQLGELYGGLPWSDPGAGYQTTVKEDVRVDHLSHEIVKPGEMGRRRDRDATPTPNSNPVETGSDGKLAVGNLSQSAVPQCAPMAIGQAPPPQQLVV